MSSQGNPPSLTLKLERDNSPFTPRSPQNFPVQLDAECEDEHEIFLAELRNAEEELGLATPGLANSPASGHAKTRKARGKGKAKCKSANDRVVGERRRPGEECWVNSVVGTSSAQEDNVAVAQINADIKDETIPESTKESTELQTLDPKDASTPSSCQPDGPREPLERDRTPGGTQCTNSAHWELGAPRGPRAPAPLARV
ncbi:hypothetical protein DFH06DRAFT_1150415 [Mycena polygramma]|nr:hypothetical protein DFH06DRAFT_1150415 [Mycena polygramma]